eukprot:31469-Pelagococcus_subviridis.AAC.4
MSRRVLADVRRELLSRSALRAAVRRVLARERVRAAVVLLMRLHLRRRDLDAAAVAPLRALRADPRVIPRAPRADPRVAALALDRAKLARLLVRGEVPALALVRARDRRVFGVREPAGDHLRVVPYERTSGIGVHHADGVVWEPVYRTHLEDARVAVPRELVPPPAPPASVRALGRLVLARRGVPRLAVPPHARRAPRDVAGDETERARRLMRRAFESVHHHRTRVVLPRAARERAPRAHVRARLLVLHPVLVRQRFFASLRVVHPAVHALDGVQEGQAVPT